VSKLKLRNLNIDFGRCLFLNGVKVRVRSDVVFAAPAFLCWGTFCGRRRIDMPCVFRPSIK